MNQTEINKIEKENWVLNGDCLNLIGDLTIKDFSEISKFDGKLINTTWKFGNEDKVVKPINKMALFDKIIRSNITNLKNQ